MVKKNKLSTPAWIIEGYDSPADYEKAKGIKKEHHKGVPQGGASSFSSSRKSKILLGTKKEGKTFKVRVCPKCGSDDVGVIISGSDSEEGGGGNWECHKCKWKGKDIVEKELNENEFMKYLDSKGEEVA